MTAAELEAALASARTEVAAMRTKLEGLKAGHAAGTLVTEKERAKAKATLERYRKAWRDRKAIVEEVRRGVLWPSGARRTGRCGVGVATVWLTGTPHPPSPPFPPRPQLINAMSEGLNKKPKELYATIGLERDEDVGVNIKDFV